MTTLTTAAVIRSPEGSFSIESVTLGELRQNEVLVRIVGTGMCHTDLLLRNPDLFGAVGPIIPGHEGAGIVEAVGSAVNRVAVGDHVLMSYDSCGWCKPCLSGGPAYCVEFELRNASGRRSDGSTGATDSHGVTLSNRWFAQSSFAKHAIATERNVVVVDDDLPLELLGPLGCGIQTGAGSVLNEMKLRPGETIAVFGVGAVGLAAIMASKIAGASHIVAVDIHDRRLTLASDLGATHCIRGDDPDLLGKLRAHGRGLDFTFDTTAVSSIMRIAIDSLDRPGKAVLVGAGAGTVHINGHNLAGRTVTYVREGSSIPQIFLPQLIEYWRAGRFPFERLITTYGMAQIDKAEKDSLSGETIKPVLIP